MTIIRVVVVLVLLTGCWTVNEPPARESGDRPATPDASDHPVDVGRPERPRAQRPVAASAPAALAVQILEAETAIRTPDTKPSALARAGHSQQVAYRRLAAKPSWEGKVLRRLPAHLHDAVTANVAAQRELAALTGEPPKELPPWRIVAPEPVSALLGYYRKAERATGIGWEYLAAIHLVETRMGRIKGDSVAGAQGPMQFIPATWASYGKGDVHDNHDAIQAAARYLKARGAPDDMDAALFAYNNSSRYVRAVQAYASVMRADPAAYRGYYHWQVYYAQPGGPVWLRVGYDGRRGNR